MTTAPDQMHGGLTARTRWLYFTLIGIGALLGSAVLAAIDGPHFFRAYLFAFVFWGGLPLGALTFALIHPLVGGSWGMAIRPVLLACVRTLPVVAVLFVPLAFGLGYLYVWAIPGGPHVHGYLTPPHFLVRAACYFAVWLIVSVPLVRWTETAWPLGSSAPNRLRAVCAAGIVLHFLVESFAAVDWVMSLEPDYYSTDFAFIFMAGQALLAFAFAVTAATWLRARRVLADGPYLKERHLTYRDLGSILAVCVLFWAYVEYAQLIINWSGDMQREASWYLHRSRGGWQVVAALLTFANFGAPFFTLLFRRVKDVPRHLAWVGLALIASHVVDVYWLVTPSFGGAFHVHWLDFVAWSGMGGLWLAAFGLSLTRPRDTAPITHPVKSL